MEGTWAFGFIFNLGNLEYHWSTPSFAPQPQPLVSGFTENWPPVKETHNENTNLSNASA
jgi:hypothetical protein